MQGNIGSSESKQTIMATAGQNKTRVNQKREWEHSEEYVAD